MGRVTHVGSRAILVVVLALALPAMARAQRYEPSLEFRTIATPHFWIHFHQGEEDLARRVAGMAEAVRASMLVGRPAPEPGKTHVILSGQDDVPNGWATTVPFNLVELRTAVPRPSASIGNSLDWLTLVFSHEYAHILHLDRSVGIMAGLRRVFGRLPLVMPNLFLPTWQVEGLATWRESAVTGLGRVRDGSARRVLGAAGRAGSFEPLDRVNGGLVSWPSGEGPYLYGALFQDYLAKRFGPDALERLTTETARWPPWIGVFAYRKVFGASAATLWREFAREWTPASPVADESDAATRLTSDGFATASPRWDPVRPGVIFYARRTPEAFPSIVEWDVATGSRRTVAEKYYGESLSVRGNRLVFDELRLERNAALVSSLHVLDDHRSREASWPLVPDARLGDADLSPDGERVVAVVTRADRRDLVVAGVSREAVPVVLVSEAGTYFSAPRWSPDGQRIAAERAEAGRLAEVVLIDARTGAVAPLIGGAGERRATPAWTPDGATVLFAAAKGDEPFNLKAADLATGQIWQVTSRRDGARAPDVSADGTRIAFLGYTVSGEDVFVAPLGRTTWTVVPTTEDRLASTTAPSMTALAPPPTSASYSPRHGFVPRYWAPDIQTREADVALGAMTSVGDALGRHQASASARVWTESARAEWSASYAYMRLRPAIFATASQQIERNEAGTLTSRALTAGASTPFITVRRSQHVLAAVRLERLQFETRDAAPLSRARHALRAGWWLNTTNSYGYSISSEEGIVAGLATEHARRAFGSDGRADWTAAEVRAYRRAGPDHAVLAGRMAAAWSSGDRGFRRRAFVNDTGPPQGVLSFDGDSVLFFRGAGVSEVSGFRALGLNLDYRWPLWRVERGFGVFPGFLRWFHAAAFIDAADAWDRGDTIHPKVAAGVEISADAVFGYVLPVTMTGGISWRIDPGRDGAAGPHGFVRVGRAF